MKIRARLGGWLTEKPDDPLPREWIASASVLSLAVGAFGSVRWGESFWENVAAGVVLLGPGLIATNLVASGWRRRRHERQIAPMVAAVTARASDAMLLIADAVLNSLGAPNFEKQRPSV